MRDAAEGPVSEAPAELLERAAGFDALCESLESVRRSGTGRVVLVGGEAGVGKTALLRWFCRERGGSAPILWGGCDPLFTPRPLGPLLSVAEEAGGPLEEVVTSGAMPHELAAALVRQLSAHPGTVFVLEDVHWADEATLDVLKLLARRVAAVPVLVVASFRDDELDASHPLRRVLGELATSATVRRLKLDRLSPAAVARLAEPRGVDPDELYRKTAGNPFFVVEALAAGVDEIPETVRDAVLARVARLSAAARSLLEAVALVPPQAELWLLDALAEDVGCLQECLASGMLAADPSGIAFRHELARLAVEDSVAPNRRVDLHRAALAALADPPSGEPDIARLAHHAEAARDADAVLRFAPGAAARAASLGAYREAAAQYARALRFGHRLSPGERADLLELRAGACYVTDEYDQGIAALREALECRAAQGDRLKEGDVLRRLSDFLWCPGRTAESERRAREAVALLETLPAGRELAMAYANLASNCLAAQRSEEAAGWAARALELGDRLEDTEIAVHALATLGVATLAAGGAARLEQSLEIARRDELAEQVARAYVLLAETAVDSRRQAAASRYLEAGIEYCSERGLELFRLYLLASQARLELHQGRWADAAESAAAVLRVQRTSITPRIVSLVVLGLVRARRGDPGQWEPLDEAWRLAEPTGELTRLGPVAAARAEAAWLEGERGAVEVSTEAAQSLAVERSSRMLAGELAVWRRRGGVDEEAPERAAEPYALELGGDWARAADAWAAIGCPYEAALALAAADDEKALRRSLAELQRLGARPAAAIVARRLRERGVRGLPRGPRAATRENPAGLTARQLEVLALLAEGLTNSQIADRLVVSQRTVDHHVATTLRKLAVRTRAEASARAVRLGLAGQDR
jgi:DNA-binding CsgD family transcriptional regulator/tetratricopeptide (TPR) repeat protein